MTWLEPSFTQPFISSPCTNQRSDERPRANSGTISIEPPAKTCIP